MTIIVPAGGVVAPTAFTLASLRSELVARGFDYLTTARQTRYINNGYVALCEVEDWPWLETTTTGVAPLTISDLAEVMYVADPASNRQVQGRDPRDILDYDPAQTTGGVPQYWWIDGSALKVWPLNTSLSLNVRYRKAPVLLSADADAPIVPNRYQTLIVDFAQIEALRDRSNYQEAQALAQSLDDSHSLLSGMRRTWFGRDDQTAQTWQPVGGDM